jgi:phospholipid/cholesterol/gamma-HCH transport system substrate-binding protein
MRATRWLASLAVAAALTACTSAGDLPLDLPGGVGADGNRVEVVFDDVLDLVEQAAVKVDDVDVGTVESIELEGWQARVTLRLKKDVDLPANAVARVRQTSLLGEKFVELSPPIGKTPTGRLADGAEIPSERSARNPEVEEVFTATAALLSGGGLAEVQTIAVELSRALAGREGEVRSVLRRLDTLVGALDARKGEIVRALDAVDRLASSLAAQKQVIGDAIDAIAPALTVLADQRADLTRLLVKLDRLGVVGTRVVNESREDTLADLRLLEPVLAQVVSVRTELGRTVDQLVSFTQLVPRAIPGDYLQLFVELYLDPSTTPTGSPAAGGTAAPRAAPPTPSLGGGDSLDSLLLGVLK